LSGPTPEDDEPITPIAYRPVVERAPGATRPAIGRRGVALSTGAAALAVLLWFSLTAVSVQVVIDPPPDDIDLPRTLLKFQIADRLLLRPGGHRLSAERSGYFPLETTLEVGDAPEQEFSFALVKLPGTLTVRVSPAQAALVQIDGEELPGDPPPPLELTPGLHRVSVQAPRYVAHEGEIEIEGGGVAQTLEVELTPAWSTVTLSSLPSGALMRAGDLELGRTPGSYELLAGEHTLEAELPGYKTWRGELVVAANQPLTLAEIILQQADGRLLLRSTPPDAHVTLGDLAAGRTPLELDVVSEETHAVTLFKPGYELATREVRIESGEELTLTVPLVPRFGTVELSVFPPDAEVRVGGKPMDARAGPLRLLAVPQSIRISKPGYAPRTLDITPRAGLPKRVEVRLRTIAEEKQASVQREIQSSQGQKLVLVEPGSFEMGSPRGEPGRRPNENQHAVELTRPFYIGVTEVTNREFRQFRPEHRSLPYAGQDLDGDSQPVTSLSWEDAARFCNWLSAREGLPPAYVERAGRLAATRPMGRGYRLPTEAEWAWVARFAGGSGGRRYPWGNELPPPPGSGNYADGSASTLVANALTSYQDGFAVAAPVASGKPNAVGVFDLGGNVAEWVQDFYTLKRAGPSGVPDRDPLGPAEGAHHVIRGSSWMHWSERQLRFAYRDYGNEGRVDVGFRIARYAD
jgi:formylglycine-generating enzyme required for sulfatase activity